MSHRRPATPSWRGTTAAVVLAAGGGSRYRGSTHKLLAPLGGSTVVERAIGEAVAAGLDATYVVTGAVDVPVSAGVVAVRNPAWAEGIATSLQAGVAAARDAGHEAVVVGLGDQPGVVAEAWRRVAAATGSPIAVATYEGRRGNPVRLAAQVWSELPASGDEGARVLMGRRPSWVREVACPGSPADIDTLEDLEAWS